MNSLRKFLQSDRKELVSILKMIASLAIAYSIHYIIPIISLQFSGHKDRDLLASVGLGISFSNAFGLTVIIGIDFAFQTLCSQAYGAKNPRRMGILLQRSIMILLVLSMPILSVWLNAENVLVLFGQDKKVAMIAGEFLTWYAPVIWIYGIFRFQCSYLACQGITRPQVLAGLFSCMTSALANYLLSVQFKAGVAAYAISTVLAFFIGCLLLTIYIKLYIDDWPGWSVECLEQWWQFMALAIPANIRVLLDWGTSETGVILMGLLGKVNLGAMLAGYNILCFLFMILQGVGVTACVKVGNYLGCADVEKAKRSAILITLCGVLLTTTNAVALLAIKDYLGYIFSSDKSVINLVSNTTPFIAVYHLLDANGVVLFGILNGLGLQRYVAITSVVAYTIIGLPVSVALAFPVKWKLIGYWIGQDVGGILVVAMSMGFIIRSNWFDAAELAIERAKIIPDSKERKERSEQDVENNTNDRDERGELLKNEETEQNGETIELQTRYIIRQPHCQDTDSNNSLFSMAGQICFVAISFSLFAVSIAIRVLGL